MYPASVHLRCARFRKHLAKDPETRGYDWSFWNLFIISNSGDQSLQVLRVTRKFVEVFDSGLRYGLQQLFIFVWWSGGILVVLSDGFVWLRELSWKNQVCLSFIHGLIASGVFESNCLRLYRLVFLCGYFRHLLAIKLMGFNPISSQAIANFVDLLQLGIIFYLASQDCSEEPQKASELLSALPKMHCCSYLSPQTFPWRTSALLLPGLLSSDRKEGWKIQLIWC